MSKLGELLRKRRKELNLSPEEIAGKIKKSVRAYKYYEEGREPRHDVLQKLAQVLEFDPGTIYETQDESREVNTLQESEIKPWTPIDKTIEAITIIAKANEKLADSNQRLTSMLEQDRKAIANDPQQTFEVFASRIQNIQELIADVATGKRFQNKKEVDALLNKVDISTFQKEV